MVMQEFLAFGFDFHGWDQWNYLLMINVIWFMGLSPCYISSYSRDLIYMCSCRRITIFLCDLYKSPT